MGNRNYRNRESKKPKKEAKRQLVTKVIPESIEVQEVRKDRRPAREEALDDRSSRPE